MARDISACLKTRYVPLFKSAGLKELKYKGVGGRWPVAWVHDEGAGGNPRSRKASPPLQKVFISIFSLCWTPVTSCDSQLVPWLKFSILTSSTLRIATQIAAGIELGAVDPLAGVTLMEQHIRDANRFATFFYYPLCSKSICPPSALWTIRMVSTIMQRQFWRNKTDSRITPKSGDPHSLSTIQASR